MTHLEREVEVGEAADDAETKVREEAEKKEENETDEGKKDEEADDEKKSDKEEKKPSKMQKRNGNAENAKLVKFSSSPSLCDAKR